MAKHRAGMKRNPRFTGQLNIGYNTLNIFLFIITFFSFTGCNKENGCDCFKGTGDITTEQRISEPFNSISLEDNINLYITRDSAYSLTVEAGEKLLPEITSEVKNGCLYLKNENKCNWVRSFKNEINVYLKCRKLYGILYDRASGDIFTADTLHTDSFRFDSHNGTGTINLILDAGTTKFNLHTGPADLNVKGKAGVNYLYSIANGRANLGEFITDITFMNSKSTNNCYVNVRALLDVEIGYIGDVYYTGNPNIVKQNITGKGKLIKF